MTFTFESSADAPPASIPSAVQTLLSAEFLYTIFFIFATLDKSNLSLLSPFAHCALEGTNVSPSHATEIATAAATNSIGLEMTKKLTPLERIAVISPCRHRFHIE